MNRSKSSEVNRRCADARDASISKARQGTAAKRPEFKTTFAQEELLTEVYGLATCRSRAAGIRRVIKDDSAAAPFFALPLFLLLDTYFLLSLFPFQGGGNGEGQPAVAAHGAARGASPRSVGERAGAGGGGDSRRVQPKRAHDGMRAHRGAIYF